MRCRVVSERDFHLTRRVVESGTKLCFFEFEHGMSAAAVLFSVSRTITGLCPQVYRQVPKSKRCVSIRWLRAHRTEVLAELYEGWRRSSTPQGRGRLLADVAVSLRVQLLNNGHDAEQVLQQLAGLIHAC